jgi:glycosyltransferase involved in cell wall biosynthesis
MMDRAPRVAIVSDALVQRGGAERVVEAMARAFPEAPIYALLYSPETGPASIADRVIVSPLGRVPGANKRHRMLLPFFPAAIESFDLSSYDLVLSSHHTVAKGVLTSGESVHVCYCHTPMRALWERSHEELATLPSPARPLAAAMFGRLRMWDSATVSRVDAFVANSATTQRRIRKHYAREAAVVYPPIDISRFRPGGPGLGNYYLVASRLVPYKRVDLAVDAARSARGARGGIARPRQRRRVDRTDARRARIALSTVGRFRHDAGRDDGVWPAGDCVRSGRRVGNDRRRRDRRAGRRTDARSVRRRHRTLRSARHFIRGVPHPRRRVFRGALS